MASQLQGQVTREWHKLSLNPALFTWTSLGMSLPSGSLATADYSEQCIRIPGNLDFRIYENPDIRISGSSDFRIFGYPDFWISGYQDIGKSGYRPFQESGFPDIRMSGNPDFRISGHPDFQISEIRKSGFTDTRMKVTSTSSHINGHFANKGPEALIAQCHIGKGS